ncbi:MAG: DUF2939 domain-containing protein [Bdellovibrionota bacterium]
MKKSVFLLISALLILAALLFWYWRQSPGYAIKSFESALRQRDLALLYSRIDLSALRASAIDALATKALTEAAEAPGFVEKLSSQIVSGAQKLTSSQSIDLIKYELELEFRRDRKKPTLLEPLLEKQSFRLFAHDIRDIEFNDWVESGSDVLLNTTIHLLKMNASYPLTLRFQRAEDKVWRLSGFEGLASLLSRYESDRDAKVKLHNEHFQGSLEDKLKFFGESRLESADAGLSSVLSLDILFQNMFPKGVKSIEGVISDTQSPHLIQESYSNPQLDIEPNQKKVFLIRKSQFLSPSNPKVQGLSLKFQYTAVEFSDGEILKAVTDFDEITF